MLPLPPPLPATAAAAAAATACSCLLRHAGHRPSFSPQPCCNGDHCPVWLGAGLRCEPLPLPSMEPAEEGVAQLALGGDSIPPGDVDSSMLSLAELAAHRSAEVGGYCLPWFWPAVCVWRGQHCSFIFDAAQTLPLVAAPCGEPGTTHTPACSGLPQGWAHLPAALLSDVFRRLLDQQYSVEEVVRTWQVGGLLKSVSKICRSSSCSPRGCCLCTGAAPATKKDPQYVLV